MAYAPIALTIPQYDKLTYANWWLKAYNQGTTTPLSMATDALAGTLLAKCELDSEGFPITAGDARFIPFINGDYDLWLFPTAAEADANDTTNAIQFADNLNADPSSSITFVAGSYTVADKSAAVLLTPVSGKSLVIEGADGGLFISVVGGSPGDYVDDGDAYCGTIIVPTGGDGSIAWVRDFDGDLFFEWFGTVEGTDSTVSMQTTINRASHTTASIQAGAYTYTYTKLYCYFTGGSSGYNDTNYRGITIKGAGPMHRQDWKADLYSGTVFESTDTTGNCFNFSIATDQAGGGVLQGISFVGATTGKLVTCDGSFSGLKLNNFFIGNDNVAGTALSVSDIWIGEISDGDIVGNKAFVNNTPAYAAGSIGLQFETDTAGGGNVLWKNVTSAFFETAMSFGKAYNIANKISKNHKMLNCQSQYSDNGLLVRHGMLDMTIEKQWCEGNAELDIKIYDSAENIKIISPLCSSNELAVGSIILGDNTTTAETDAVYGVTMEDPYLAFCDYIGIKKYAAALDVLLYRPVFKNNGGAAIHIDQTETAELEVWNPEWFPEIAGAVIPEGRQVCTVTGSFGSASYADARNLVRDGDIGRISTTADLDMSTWRKPIRKVVANTTSADITISLPTGTSVYGGTVEVTKPFANNSAIIDSGTGNLIKYAADFTGAQTYSIDGINMSIRVSHLNEGDTSWYLSGSTTDSDGVTGASVVTGATGTVKLTINGVDYNVTYE